MLERTKLFQSHIFLQILLIRKCVSITFRKYHNKTKEMVIETPAFQKKPQTQILLKYFLGLMTNCCILILLTLIIYVCAC